MKRLILPLLMIALMGQSAWAQSKKDQIATLQQTVDNLSQQLEATKTTLNNTQVECKKMTNLYNASQQTVNELRQSLDEAQKALRDQQRESSERIAKLQKELDDARKNLSNTNAQLNEKLHPTTGYNLQGKIKITGSPQYAYAELYTKDDDPTMARGLFFNSQKELVEVVDGEYQDGSMQFIEYYLGEGKFDIYFWVSGGITVETGGKKYTAKSM